MVTGDFGENHKCVAKVFGEKVSTKLSLKAIEDAKYAIVSPQKGVVVADIGDDNVGFG